MTLDIKGLFLWYRNLFLKSKNNEPEKKKIGTNTEISEKDLDRITCGKKIRDKSESSYFLSLCNY